MPARDLRGVRYLDQQNVGLAQFVMQELHHLTYDEARNWYAETFPTLTDKGLALLGCNDRYFMLTGLLRRRDAVNPWLFARCREVEAEPDGHIDLWARFHYKSTIITYAGAIQEVVCNPDIKIAIFSVVKPIAEAFLSQIKEEFEGNEELKRIYSDVLWDAPKVEASKWALARGITVKRRSNPKEASIEAHGLIDGQPTSRHYDLHIYDDIVTQDYISQDNIKKTTERWELADNLGSHLGIRKWICGTRFSFADTYGVILERSSAKPRIYPATDDGTITGNPVFLANERWEQIKNDQRSTVSAQMLLNPAAGTDATFQSVWLQSFEVFPETLNVYIMVDPSKGTTHRSDRTAISVVGLDQAGNKYLLDGYCHRMKLSDRYQFIRRLVEKWERRRGVQLVKVGYERYGQQVDLEVIEEYQKRDGKYFPLAELNTPRQGRHSKADRIERLEPDFRRGIFYLPAVVYHPDSGDREGNALWQVWTDEDYQRQAKLSADPKANHNVGQILYRRRIGLTRAQRRNKEMDEEHPRIVRPIKRRDEDNNIYDLTRVFIDEYIRHPFATHDDMLDATSRIYDMEAHTPIVYSATATGTIEVDEWDIAMTGGDDGEDPGLLYGA